MFLIKILFDTDLEEQLNKVLEKYEKRLQKKAMREVEVNKYIFFLLQVKE